MAGMSCEMRLATFEAVFRLTSSATNVLLKTNAMHYC